MVSGFPAGLDRQTLETVLNLDDEVLSFRRINDAGAMWLANVSVEGGDPVDVIVDNGINEIYVQALIRLDYEEISSAERNLVITAAMTALEPYSTVGLTQLGSGVYLRSAFFIDHSTIHAFTNSLKAVVLAHSAYQRQLPVAAEALRT